MSRPDILTILGPAVTDDPGETVQEIAVKLRVSDSTARRRVRAAEKKGLLFRGVSRRLGRPVPVYRVKP